MRTTATQPTAGAPSARTVWWLFQSLSFLNVSFAWITASISFESGTRTASSPFLSGCVHAAASWMTSRSFRYSFSTSPTCSARHQHPPARGSVCECVKETARRRTCSTTLWLAKLFVSSTNGLSFPSMTASSYAATAGDVSACAGAATGAGGGGGGGGGTGVGSADELGCAGAEGAAGAAPRAARSSRRDVAASSLRGTSRTLSRCAPFQAYVPLDNRG